MKKLVVHSQEHLRFIIQDDISHCKSDNCYTSIFLSSGQEIVLCKSLKKLQAELDPETFIRINQSYIVNKNYIQQIDKKKKYIELAGNTCVPFTITLSSLLNMIIQNAAFILLYACSFIE